MLQARPGKNFHQKLYISYDSKIFLQICTVDLLSTSSAWQASMVKNVKLKHDLDTIFWNFCTIFLHSAVVVVASPLKKRTLILECSKFNCHLFRIFAHSAKIGFLYFHFSRYVKYRICLTAFTPTCQSKNKYNFPIYLLQRSQLPTNLSWFYLKCQFNHTLAWADRGGNFRG